MPLTKSATEPGGRLASYVDRIVRGEKRADLPAQDPTKYGLAINFKAAKALGLEANPLMGSQQVMPQRGRYGSGPNDG